MQEVVLDRIEFSILGRVEIARGVSSLKIDNPMHTVVFAKNRSLHDTRLGAFKNVPCGTCGGNAVQCGGHFGHIELIWPVVNPSFAGSTLRRILCGFCAVCLRMTERCACNEPRADDEPCKKRRKKIHPTHIKIDANTAYTPLNAGNKLSYSLRGVPVSTRELYLLVQSVPRAEYLTAFPEYGDYQDLTDLCFTHNLPVLPIALRPPNFVGGAWKPENVTRLYIEVLKRNQHLRLKIGVVITPLLEEYHHELQSAVNVLFDVKNTRKRLQAKVIQNGGLRQRIDGKQGRIRKNLMGKRTDFSARSVLSGDPRLGINEVGLPPSVAANLTVPVMVTRHNIGSLGKFSIRYVFKANGDRFDTRINTRFLDLIEIGDKVERSLVDGDVVLVNRQPTLHRGSMIGCYVRIVNSSTFRLNYSTMVTLNADTDGDEVNVHVPQDLASRAEAEELMMASTNIVCSQDSVPLVGCTQDSLLGCYQLSKNDRLSTADYMALLFELGLDDPRFTGDRAPVYRGVEIMDRVLEGLGMEFDRIEIPKSNFLMVDSKVLRGVFDKRVMGASDNSVIHHIYLSYGHLLAAKFIHQMQTAATAYLDMDGFSVGIADCVVSGHEPIHDGALDDHIQTQFDEHGVLPDEGKLLQATGLLTRLEGPPGVTPENNALLAMIVSGSKGSMLNFNQITRLVGQQVVGSGRVPKDFASGHRTLPHFNHDELSLRAGGYVNKSFTAGLSPDQFFYHAMAGRIGLIDTSIKTADTGAQYRRLVKMLERVVVTENHLGGRMVTNSTTGMVIQFNFGEDDLDGTYMKRIQEEDVK
jgi:DNA-directed RNA polymerase II subunit RPB1